MYRRKVSSQREGRRLNSRGEEDSDNEMVQSSDIPHVEFISRISNLPVVSSALGFASGAYGKAKKSSPLLIQKTLDTAEGTMKYAATRAAPVMNTFEKPIHMVDSLACKTLDKVEQTLPIVTREPNEIVKDTRNYVSEKMQPVHTGVDSACNLMAKTVDLAMNNPIGGMVINTAVGAVTTVEENVNHYLPPAENEPPMEDEVVTGVPSKKVTWCLQRSFGIAGAVWRRTWQRSQHFVHQFLMRMLVYVGAIINIMEWVQTHWKEVRISGLPAKFRELADDINRQMSHEGPGRESVSLFRGLVDRLKGLASKTAGLLLRIPLFYAGKTRDQAEGALNMATNVAANVVKYTRMDQVAISAMVTFQQQLPLVYHPVMETATFVTDMMKKVFPNWNFDMDGIVRQLDSRINEARTHQE